jgi:hypothetical protein
MDLHTQPSLVFDTKILENGIIKIPELNEWQNQYIHIVIVFKTNEHKSVKQITSIAGKLKKYANPSLIDFETDLAWSNLIDN